MSEPARGILYMVAACVIWGLSPLYYRMLSALPPMDVLGHRTLWSLVFFTLVLLGRRQLGTLWGLLRRAPGRVAMAGGLIASNWLIFIWSVQSGRVVEAAMGYYIFPLVAVALGALVFGERLTRLQWAAVGLAVLAVGVLAGAQGVDPWVPLGVALTFGLYGLLKKRLDAGPVVSVTGEVALLAPLFVLWLGWGHPDGAGLMGPDRQTLVLLLLSGPLTATPLILFSAASRRVRLSTVGLVQYLNPTLQFLCATLVLGEPVTLPHLIAFVLIWTGIALYSLSAGRSARRVATSAGTSGTAVR